MASSGFVFLPRMPDIIRLRTSGDTTSGNFQLSPRRGVKPRVCLKDLARIEDSHNVRLHEPGDLLHDRGRYGVSELPVGSGVGNRDRHASVAVGVETHKARAFPWCKPPRIFAFLRDQYF